MGLPDAEAYWHAEHGEGWFWQYWNSYRDEHRDFWLAHVGGLMPCVSLLEVGCHVGPNLRRVREAYPDVTLTGIDPCEAAIAFARAQSELDGVRLETGDVAQTLSVWPDRSFDIVASCYALSYVQPTALLNVLRDCWRLANKALVIFEPMTFDDQTRLWVNGGYVEFQHPYLWVLAHLAECHGLTADVMGYESDKHRLNGLIVVRR